MSYRKKYLKSKLKKLRPRKAFYKRRVFLIIVGIITLLLSAYFILFSKAVQISNIEIIGNEKIAAGDIEKFVRRETATKILDWGFIRLTTRSFFLVKTNLLEKTILLEFPSLESAKTTKRIFRREVLASVKERVFFATFCQADANCFSMDGNGIIFEKSESNENSFIVKNEKSVGEAVLGEKVIEKSKVNAIDAIEKDLKSNFEIGIKEVIIGNPLIVITTENWRIYFDPEEDVRIQIAKLNALLEKEIPPETRKKIQYIYLQYKDRAYYK